MTISPDGVGADGGAASESLEHPLADTPMGTKAKQEIIFARSASREEFMLKLG
jgi:hypothetical protein